MFFKDRTKWLLKIAEGSIPSGKSKCVCRGCGGRREVLYYKVHTAGRSGVMLRAGGFRAVAEL